MSLVTDRRAARARARRRTRRGRRGAPPPRRRVEGAARVRHPPVAAARPVGRRRGPPPRVRRRRDGAVARQPVGRLGRRRDRCAPVAARAVRRARPGGDVGRRPGDDAQLVVQPDRQGREGRRRLPASRPLVVLVGLRPLPRREPRRRRPRWRRCPTSARSCCCPASTASRTTGTSPGSRPPGARTSSSRRRSSPEHRTQSHLDYAMGAALPGQDRNDGVLYRLPWSVVFNMALAASILGSAQGFVDVWIDESRDRVLTGGARMADDALSQRRLAGRAVGPRRRRHGDAGRRPDDVGHGRGARDRRRWVSGRACGGT